MSLSFLLVMIPCFSQIDNDSLRVTELLENSRQDFREMSDKYQRIEKRLSAQESDFFLELNKLKSADSLQERTIDGLAKTVDSLKNRMLETRRFYDNEAEKLKRDLYRTRKGNATFLIIIFSLLVLNFVYFIYRNYRLKLYVNHKVMNSFLQVEQNFSKLRKKLKKRQLSFSESMDRKFVRRKEKRKKKKKK